MSSTSGTARTLSYLLTQEFQDGQPANSITPQFLRDLIVSINSGTITPPVPAINQTVRMVPDTTITQLSTDDIIVVTAVPATFGPTIFINLLASPVIGAVLTIKDGSGCSETSPIIITPANGVLIDGQSNYALVVGYSSVGIVWNGSQWNVINTSYPPVQNYFQGDGVNPSSSATITLTHLPNASAYWVSSPFQLKVTVRDVNLGDVYVAYFTCVLHTENAVTTINNSAPYAEVNTTGGSDYIGFGAETMGLAWSNIAADASSFDLTITNNNTDPAEIFNLWVSLTDLI